MSLDESMSILDSEDIPSEKVRLRPLSSVASINRLDRDVLQPEKQRLRPFSSLSSVKREEIIQKNLMSMEENIAKKRRAQARYYQQQGHSPLLRSDGNKPSVHDRLGGLLIRNKKRVPIIGTNTNYILPRNKFYSFKNCKRKFSAQSRIDKIRHMNQSSMLITHSDVKKFRVPTLKVQVLNDSSNHVMLPRFRLILNPHIQTLIREIQLAHPRQIIHGVHPIMPVTTASTLNERFTHLS